MKTPKRFMRLKIDQDGQQWIKRWDGSRNCPESKARWRKIKYSDILTCPGNWHVAEEMEMAMTFPSNG